MIDTALNEAAAQAGTARKRAALRILALALIAFTIVNLLAARESWPVARELVLSRGSGWIALSALFSSLCVSPFARAATRAGFRVHGAAVMRRALGMAAAWLALAHALTALGGTLLWDVRALFAWPHLSAGLAALAILLVLLATSFTAVVVRARLAFFKELHRLAYVAAAFVSIHLLLGPFAPRALTLALFALVLLFGLLRRL